MNLNTKYPFFALVVGKANKIQEGLGPPPPLGKRRRRKTKKCFGLV
jgi:hypothetical protein